jgi:NAD(P)-dependent dehydrogenase (short-subunit alcohol dehydrogenase family)
MSKVVVVTGASQGIGAGIVQAFRSLNYCIVANSRSMEPSDDPNILTVPGDISTRETAINIIKQGLQRFGRIDSLINNAGIFIAKPFTEYTEADFDSVFAINVTGFFHITQAVIAQMLEQGSGGHIVNITAALADQPSSKHPAFLASITKGGLNSATRALAIEYAARGIRVNAVAPGATKTPMHAVQTHETLAKAHPIGRMAEVSDIAGAVLYLETAPFVTGVILPVDGGLSAGQ